MAVCCNMHVPVADEQVTGSYASLVANRLSVPSFVGSKFSVSQKPSRIGSMPCGVYRDLGMCVGQWFFVLMCRGCHFWLSVRQR
jgi:hypothetical protein